MHRKIVMAAVGAVVAASTFVLERDATACGGCFAPQENPTVVTDHRMIMSISRDQSTLYDQIAYSGSPESFAWVLPIAGTVNVGLSADVVFSGLDQITQTQLLAPPLNCPTQPSNCNQFGARATSDSAGGPAPNEVEVLKREVVGPYDTVQLKSDDPAALESWLATNGFTIPADVKPVISQYVTEKFNFLALKLVPGKGVNDMRPVRVTTQGAGSVLPLRMVAAGTGATVGISLWVVSEGRYEPQNFASFHIDTNELLWDWTQQKSNYVDLRAEKTQAGGGRIWEVESSTILYRQTLESVIRYGFFGGNGGGVPANDDESRAQQDYLPITDASGNVIKTAVQVRDEDMEALFHGIPTATSRVTRLRADLAHAALDQDLGLTASADQAILSNVRQLTREANQPQCPVFNGCDQVGTAPRDEAFARSTGSADTFSCSTRKNTSPTWIGAGLGAAAIALVHGLRRRRAEKAR